MRFESLVLVSPDENFNRVFEMEEKPDGTFVTRLGRVEATPVERTYSIALWDTVLKKHLNQGFVRTAMQRDIKVVRSFAPIADEYVEELFQTLMKKSSLAIQKEYSVSSTSVSAEALERAQDMILKLSYAPDVQAANQSLENLFCVIPRKMRYVSDYLLTDIAQLPEVCEREQDLLDAMKSQKSVEASAEISPTKTILDAFGLKCRCFTAEETAQTLKHLGASRGMFVRGFRVNNLAADERFAKKCADKKVHFFYHGSKTMNYLGIMKDSLLLNPKAPITGKMFGHGIYFADDADKSIGYTDMAGSRWAHGGSKTFYLMIFKVGYSNPYHVSKAMPGANLRTIRPHDAVFAHKGVQLLRDEFIIYDEAQCAPYAILEMKR